MNIVNKWTSGGIMNTLDVVAFSIRINYPYGWVCDASFTKCRCKSIVFQANKINNISSDVSIVALDQGLYKEGGH